MSEQISAGSESRLSEIPRADEVTTGGVERAEGRGAEGERNDAAPMEDAWKRTLGQDAMDVQDISGWLWIADCEVDVVEEQAERGNNLVCSLASLIACLAALSL